jgi:uncharacterized membrane protein HdeD (DUF308 family)
MLAGVARLVSTLRGTRWLPGFASFMLTSLLAVTAGALLVWPPPRGISATTVLAGYLVAAGCVLVYHAVAYRRVGFSPWGWRALNGLAAIALGAALPFTPPWAPGLMLAAHLGLGGLALLARSKPPSMPAAARA